MGGRGSTTEFGRQKSCHDYPECKRELSPSHMGVFSPCPKCTSSGQLLVGRRELAHVDEGPLGMEQRWRLPQSIPRPVGAQIDCAKRHDRAQEAYL